MTGPRTSRPPSTRCANRLEAIPNSLGFVPVGAPLPYAGIVLPEETGDSEWA
jgi:hypothetical protein